MANPTSFSGCAVGRDNSCCFDTLTPDELELLNSNLIEIHYKKGEMICKQGTFASNIMFICSGLVKVYYGNIKDSVILKILPARNLVGLSSLFEENTLFQYSAYAYQDSVIQQIDINVFRQLTKQNPLFANEIINILSENVTQIYGRFFCFTHKQSYGRLADILLCLATRIYKANEFDLRLTRKELAELSGMSTERVIRILKKFKEEGLIEINDKTFKILDDTKLQQISERG